MDLQWKRDMRQGVVTCLCEVGLGCGAFPWIGGAQQEKQMVFGLESHGHPVSLKNRWTTMKNVLGRCQQCADCRTCHIAGLTSLKIQIKD